MDPQGVIHHVAGVGSPGYSGDGGLATKAKIDFPRGLALAPDGGLYIADYGNNVVRRVAPDGVITTVVGKGFLDPVTRLGGFSGDGGPAIDAMLNGPQSGAFAPITSWIYTISVCAA